MASEPATSPMDLPGDFDPVRNMPVRTEDTGEWHASRLAAEFAAKLVAHGAPEDLELAEKVLQSVADCQETRPGHPHRGNYRWEYEDAEVEDLNAVHFVLIELLPMLANHRDRLSPECLQQTEDNLRLALEAIARIDVSLDYTNIVVKDFSITLLGGELLQDEAFQRRGRLKLEGWLRHINHTGGPFELNSPVYTPLCIKALSLMSMQTRDADVAVLARLACNRLAVSYALHIHPETGRLAGPYCRAYDVHPYAEHGVEAGYLKRTVDAGLLPDWIGEIPGSIPLPRELREGFSLDQERMHTTWISPSFSLGSATTELDSQAIRFIAGQSSVFLMNVTDPDLEDGGLVYTRYLLDEKWHGGTRPIPSRDYSKFLCEEGRYLGVQSGASCIGAYAPRDLGAMEFHHAAKLAMIIANRDLVRQVMVAGNAVSRFPVDVPEESVIGFEFADSYLAVRPFSRSCLGARPPLRIVERGEDLVFEVYNVLGPSRTFWELATPGSFYQGQPQCAFYAEGAERADHADLVSFCGLIESGTFVDEVDPLPDSQSRTGQRAWRMGYHRESQQLGQEVDLLHWRHLFRTADHSPLSLTPLQSPSTVQGKGRILEAGGARLDPGTASLWLHGNPATRTWVVGGMATPPSTWTLHLPGQTLEVSGFRFGQITVRDGAVSMDTNPETEWVGHPPPAMGSL